MSAGRKSDGKSFSIWIPFWLLCLLILPMMILLLPLMLMACLIVRVSPVRTMCVGWGILRGVKGTEVEVAHGQRLISVQIP
jgi:hypothetical protein